MTAVREVVWVIMFGAASVSAAALPDEPPLPVPSPDPLCARSKTHAFWTTGVVAMGEERGGVTFQVDGSDAAPVNCNSTTPCREEGITVHLPRPWWFEEPISELPDPLEGQEDPVVECEPLPPVAIPTGDGDNEFTTGQVYLPADHHEVTEYTVTAFAGDGPFFLGADGDGDNVISDAPPDCLEARPGKGTYQSGCQQAGSESGWWMWRACDPAESTSGCLLSGFITTD